MLAQYVQVEQLGPIYVCDTCNGNADVSFCQKLVDTVIQHLHSTIVLQITVHLLAAY